MAMTRAKASQITTKLGSTGTVRGLDDKLAESVSVKDFGAIGDGVANDTAAIQTAITSSSGKTLYFPAGTYRITSTITVTNPVAIECDPDAVFDCTGLPTGTTLSDSLAFRCTGSISSSVALTASPAAGASTLAITSTSGIVAGDYIVVQSNEVAVPGATTTSTRGQIVRVKTVASGTSLTLFSPLLFEFDHTQNGRISKLNLLKGVSIRGGKAIGGGVGQANNFIQALYTDSFRLSEMDITDFESIAVDLNFSVNGSVSKCDIRNATSPTPIGNTGYGVQLFRSDACSVTENTFTNCRHAEATGGNTCATTNVLIANNQCTGCGLGTTALDCHEPTYMSVFEGNTINGGDGGIVVRGFGNLVANNTIFGVNGNGIRVSDFHTNSLGINNTVVSGNVIRDTVGDGIEVDDDSSDIVSRVSVSGNNIENAGLYGIFLRRVKNASVTSNVIFCAAATAHAIYVLGVSGNESNSIAVSGNSIFGGTSHAIRVEFGRGISISGNTIESPSQSGIRLTDTNFVNCVGNQVVGFASNAGTAFNHGISLTRSANTTVSGNMVVNSTVATGYPINVETSSSVAITGNTLIGRSAATSQDGIRVFNGSGTNRQVIVTGNVIKDCGRYAVYSTNTDEIIVTSNHVLSCVNATKVLLTGAVSLVNTNNI